MNEKVKPKYLVPMDLRNEVDAILCEYHTALWHVEKKDAVDRVANALIALRACEGASE